MPIPELMAGWLRFRTGRFRDQRELFGRLAREGQRPTVALVACCDSRVDPAIVFDCDPGELFVLRNIANLVPPFEQSGRYHGTSAALEFAVIVLGVRHVAVLGHSQCGGIRSLMQGPPVAAEPLPFVSAWTTLAEDARVAANQAVGLDQEARVTLCEREAIRVSMRNLLTFPSIQARVTRGELSLHGWHFDLAKGLLSVLDETSSRFVPIGADPGQEAAG